MHSVIHRLSLKGVCKIAIGEKCVDFFILIGAQKITEYVAARLLTGIRFRNDDSWSVCQSPTEHNLNMGVDV